MKGEGDSLKKGIRKNDGNGGKEECGYCGWKMEMEKKESNGCSFRN